MVDLDRRHALATIAAAAAATVVPARAQQPSSATPYKVGYVYVSPISDAGWTYQHDTRRP